MKEIVLANGGVALVDDEDFDKLSKFKWSAIYGRHTCYAKRESQRINGVRGTTIRMHQEIMNTHNGEFIDHKDGNGLNNQKANLRFCTNQQNRMNSNSVKGSTSRFKGVTWRKDYKKWRGQIVKDGKHFHLGYHDSEIDAALAYNNKAIELFGDYARPNVI